MLLQIVQVVPDLLVGAPLLFHDIKAAPQAVQEATSKFWDVMNDVGQFLEDSYEIGDSKSIAGASRKRDLPGMVPAADLLVQFNLWAQSSSRPTLSAKKFGDHMKELMGGSGTFGAGRLEKIKLQECVCYYPLVPVKDRLGDD
jgi:hypothetical protein